MPRWAADAAGRPRAAGSLGIEGDIASRPSWNNAEHLIAHSAILPMGAVL